MKFAWTGRLGAGLLACAMAMTSACPQTLPSPTFASVSIVVANASSTGTTVNKLAKLTGAPSAAVILGSSDQTGIVGVVVGGAGTSGNAQITIAGQASCIFDGTTTAGDFVQSSSIGGAGGECHDAGSSYPTSGEVLGRVLSSNAGGGTYAMLVFPPEVRAGAGGAGTVTSITCFGSAITTSGTCTTAGQLPGTTTNDGASAGNVGEFVVSGASSFNNTIANNSGTVTITIASPAVISWTGNPYYLATATGNGCAAAVVFSTTGSLPTGLSAGTVYFVTCDSALTANAFHVSTSVANAVAGTAVNTSGSQSGTQSASNAVPLANAAPQDFGGLSLTAGDWDVTGVVHFNPASTTSITAVVAGTSSGSALSGTFYSILRQAQAAEVPNSSFNLGMSTERVSLAATTTIYCGVLAIFTVSTLTAAGECRARRVR